MDPFVHDWVLGIGQPSSARGCVWLDACSSRSSSTDGGSCRFIGFSGGGLRDTTRIAASSPEMWRDISLANRQNLVRMIETYIQHLEKFKDLLEKKDGVGLVDLMSKAKELRERLK